MFRLIHISDLHYAPLPPARAGQLCNKRLIGWLNWRFNRGKLLQSGAYDALIRHIMAQDHDHLAISGDLVNLALPAEFAQARANIAALGAPQNVSLVFGNHDAYVPGALAEACGIFRPWIEGDGSLAPAAAGSGAEEEALRLAAVRAATDQKAEGEKSAAAQEAGAGEGCSPVGQKAKESSSIFAEAGQSGQAAAKPSALFPYLRRRGPAAIIGVNSACAMPPFFAAGYFGAAQARRLKALLAQARSEGLFRIVMIHHPPVANAAPWQKKLWGIARFQRVIAEEGAELILHGHTHLPSLSYLPARAGAENPQGRAAVLGVPSAAQEFGGHKPPAGYNLVEISGDRGEFRCNLRRFALSDSADNIACVGEGALLP